jgi:hypothetical protein
MQVPSYLVDTMLGLVVLFVVSSDILVRWRARRRQLAEVAASAAATPLPQGAARAAEGADE